MKRVERFLLEACSLSVLIMGIFFICAKLSAPEITPALHFGRFFLILLFGFLIVAANFLFKVNRIHRFIAVLIHYAVILAAFMLIFVELDGITSTRVFIFIALFTVFYALFFGIVIGIKHLAAKLDGAIAKKVAKEAKPEAKYQPRYK